MNSTKNSILLPGFVAAEIKSTKGDMITVVTAKGVEVRPTLLSFTHDDSERQTVNFSENLKKGRRATNESTEVRQDRGHGQPNLPQRRVRFSEPQATLLHHDDLCEIRSTSVT